MEIFERSSPYRRPVRPTVRGFSLTELLVVMAIVLVLSSMAGAAISAASSSQKKLRTKALVGKLHAIVAAHYAKYGTQRVEAASGSLRGQALRAIAQGDLPDDWTIVSGLATKSSADLTPHQLAYAAVWNATANKQAVTQSNSGAECLFMIVMQGGIADCLDCRGLRIEIGDQDGDGMPEFLDAWGSPLRLILWPSDLQLPPGSGKRFFSTVLPFDAFVPTIDDSIGGLMRPLIVSAGPDRLDGLTSTAAAVPGGTEHLDNITSFDDEAKR
jgi:prepilin-type N-terminal cleavage/methylation domain-containing protein